VGPDIRAFASQAEWLEWQELHHEVLASQHVENRALLAALPTRSIEGFCSLCDAQRSFGCTDDCNPATLSLRESLSCDTCHNNARQRAAAQVLLDCIDPRNDAIYVTEQASYFYLQLSARCRSVRGSEFTSGWGQRFWLWLWLLRHGHKGWLRRETVTRLTFGDRSLDAVVTLDVLEHVPDAKRALAEFARVLRPGGHLVLTVPFYCAQHASEEVARVGADGTVEYMGTPEFHGDPLGGGVLCFHHFGWDLLESMRNAGFSEAVALRVRDPASGLPEANWILRATR
jgi:SAM-dependent methyltransferase